MKRKLFLADILFVKMWELNGVGEIRVALFLPLNIVHFLCLSSDLWFICSWNIISIGEQTMPVAQFSEMKNEEHYYFLYNFGDDRRLCWYNISLISFKNAGNTSYSGSHKIPGATRVQFHILPCGIRETHVITCNTQHFVCLIDLVQQKLLVYCFRYIRSPTKINSLQFVKHRVFD